MVKIWKIMSVPLGNWAPSLSICSITVMHDHITAQLHRCPTGKTKNMSETDGRGDRNHFMRQTYSSQIFPGAFLKMQFPHNHWPEEANVWPWRNHSYTSVSMLFVLFFIALSHESQSFHEQSQITNILVSTSRRVTHQWGEASITDWTLWKWGSQQKERMFRSSKS